MTSRLVLMRHAKAEPDSPSGDDHSRPLAPRGLADAFALGRWLQAQGYLAESAVVSTALRTRQSYEQVCAGGAALPNVKFEDAIYEAAPETLWQLLRAQVAPSVLMIGHNPGMETLLALALATSPVDRPKPMPTGAIYVLDFPADWAELTPHSATLVAHMRPKDL